MRYRGLESRASFPERNETGKPESAGHDAISRTAASRELRFLEPTATTTARAALEAERYLHPHPTVQRKLEAVYLKSLELSARVRATSPRFP